MSLAGRPDEEQSIRTIHAALDAGVNLIDTADAYARDDRDIGHGERLIAKALKGRRDDVLVATKGGLTRNRDRRWPPDGRPEHLRAACEASLRALETDRIDLYQFHRPDPECPTPSRSGRSRSCRTRARCAGWASPTPRWPSSRRLWASSTSSRSRISSRSPTLADRQGRAAGLHGARHRLPAVVAAGRHRLLGVGRGRRPGRGARPRRTACRPSRSRWRGCSRSVRR